MATRENQDIWHWNHVAQTMATGNLYSVLSLHRALLRVLEPSRQSCEAGSIIILILKIRELKPREVK